MSSMTNVATGVYIYAFLRANHTASTQSVLSQLTGIDGAAVTMITQGDVVAAVSSTEAKRIRPQRKNLAAHQEVVTYLARNCDMLPVAFGLIADDRNQVEHLMNGHQTVLIEQLERVSGHLEMAVNLRWAVPNIFQYFVEKTPELLDARTAIAEGRASRDDQIAMGQHFEKLLNAERSAHADAFLSELNAVCKEIDIQSPRDEADVLRAACLIPRNGESAFNDAVYRAAGRFSDEFAVSFNGPWPTYSFVKLALSLE